MTENGVAQTCFQYGFMSAHLVAANRSDFSSPRLRGGSDPEKVAAFDTYEAYAGSYNIQADQVIHRVHVSLFPNWVGKDRVRKLELQEDRLTLRSDAGYAIWERA